MHAMSHMTRFHREWWWKRKQMVDDVTACRPNQFPPSQRHPLHWVIFTLLSHKTYTHASLRFGDWEMRKQWPDSYSAIIKMHSSYSFSSFNLSFFSRPTHVTKLHALNSFPSLPVADSRFFYDWNNHPSPLSLSIQFHIYSPTKDQHFAKRIPVSYFISLMTWESEWGSVRLESVCKKYDTSHNYNHDRVERGAFLFFHFLRPYKWLTQLPFGQLLIVCYSCKRMHFFNNLMDRQAVIDVHDRSLVWPIVLFKYYLLGLPYLPGTDRLLMHFSQSTFWEKTMTTMTTTNV